MGHATLATSKKGERIVAALVKNLVAFIDEARSVNVDLKVVSVPG